MSNSNLDEWNLDTAAGDQMSLMPDAQPEQIDNITDWCLDQFQTKYGSHITKDDIWEYLYGVMHAPDWREKYKHDLQKTLPRVPLADDFEAFRAAGRELMDLHVGYEDCDELEQIICLVDGEPADEHYPDSSVFRIHKKMRWGKQEDSDGKSSKDDSTLIINDRCRLVGIPPESHEYAVSGRSPLQWAVSVLECKSDSPSGIVSDPNQWETWADEPFILIQHLRRLAFLGQRSAEIINMLPAAICERTPQNHHEQDTP